MATDDHETHGSGEGPSPNGGEDGSESASASTSSKSEPAPESREDCDSNEQLGAAVVTVSSTRSLEEDESGDAVVTALEAGEYDLATRELIENGYDTVQSIVSRLVDRDDVDVVVTVGGTGLAEGDVTLEAVRPLLDKEMESFCDLFTRLCYEEVGTGVLCARSMGGVVDGSPVFCLPDDVATTQVATESIIVTETPRIVASATPDDE